MNNLHLNVPLWHSVTGTYCARMDSFFVFVFVFVFFFFVCVCFFFCLLLSSLFVILHLHRQLSHFLGAFWKVPVFSGCNFALAWEIMLFLMTVSVSPGRSGNVN